MNKKLSLVIIPILLFVLYISLSSNGGGINGVSVSGCSCHGAASSNTVVTITGLPPGGYTSGITYSLTLSVTNNTFAGSAGFDMTASSGSFTSVAGTALNGATEIRHNTPKVRVAGTASWTFNWTAPPTGNANVTFAVSGNAVNANGNTSGDQWNQTSTTIFKSGAVLAVIATAPNITCNGGVATITASGQGPTLPYQYSRNGGAFQTSPSFTANLAGTYTITVRDATLATATTTVNITQPAIIVPSLSSGTILCNAGTTTLTASATGGTGTISYSLNGGSFQTSTLFTNRVAGNYTVTARDANLCTKTATLVVTQPTIIAFQAPSLTNPLCNGSNTGAISVNTTGGTGAKNYAISPLGPQTNGSGSFSNLTAQSYTITVTDANNCTKTTVTSLTQPSAINFLTPTIVQPTCNGAANGTIAILASGGNGAKTYTITPLGPQSNTTGNFNNLSAQQYTITATDVPGCTKTTVVNVAQPFPVFVEAPDVSGCTGNAITLNGNPSGGVYSVANPYSGPSTTYTYTVTDGNGCVGSDEGNIYMNSVVLDNVVASNPTICKGGNTQVSVKLQDEDCIPTVLNPGCINVEYIANVTFGAINNTSSCGAAYTDYSSTISTTRSAGISYPISLSNGNYFVGDQWGVWIDFNQNGVFTDAGEFTTFPASGTITTGSIYIPQTALDGFTKMRVRLNFTGTMLPCGTNSWGEAEDYGIIISEGVTSTNPPLSYSWSNNISGTYSTPNQASTNANSIDNNETLLVTVTSHEGCIATASTLISTTNGNLFTTPNANPSSVCIGGSSTLSVTPVDSVANYCIPSNANNSCSNLEFIEEVSFNTINNVSTCSTTGANGYTDYTAISTSITAGNTYPITLKDGAFFVGDNWYVWIDYNQNGIFGDAGEITTFSTSGPITAGNIIVPSTAYNGPTRMRVRLAFSSSSEPCGVSSWGEIEDYTINISGGVTPPPYLSYQWSNNLNSTLTTPNAISTVANNITSVENYHILVTRNDGCFQLDSVAVDTACGSTLALKLFLQGFYTGNSFMSPTLLNQGVSTDPLITDSILVELHATVFPYSKVDSQVVLLSTNGTATCTFMNTGFYYLAIKHRNSIQTWSATPVELTANTSYIFSDAANKAYGSNMVEVENGIWAFYCGDVVQDNNIDLIDLASVESDISNFYSGYYATDITGDGNVDLLDGAPVEVNVNNFIFAVILP